MLLVLQDDAAPAFVTDVFSESPARELESQRYNTVEHTQGVFHCARKRISRRGQSPSWTTQRLAGSSRSMAFSRPARMKVSKTINPSEARPASGRTAACGPICEDFIESLGLDDRFIHSTWPLSKNAPPNRASCGADQPVPCDQDESRLPSIYRLWKRSLSVLVESANHVDPLYRCSRAANASSFNRAVEYFWHGYHLNYSRWYPIFGVEAIHSRFVWALLEQEPFMHIWLGFVHLNKAALGSGSISNIESRRHIGIGISQVRQIITKGVGTGFQNTERDCLVASIFFLALVAQWQKEPETSELHRKNMISLIASQGGSEKLGCEGWLSAAILHDEFLHQLDTAETAFPSHYPSCHPVLKEAFTTELREQIAVLPYGFQHLVKIEAFPVDLVRLLIRIQTAHGIEGQSGEAHDQFYSGPRKYSGFWEACSPLRTAGPSFRKFLCLTLLLYVQIQFAPNRQILSLQLAYTSPRLLLTKQMHLLEKLVRSKASRECWVWMWMVLVDSWVDRTKTGRLTDEGGALLVKFHRLFSEVKQWDDVSRVLDKFFCPANFREACKEQWQEATGRERMRPLSATTATCVSSSTML